MSIGNDYKREFKHNITLFTVNNNDFVNASLTLINDFIKLIRICSYIFGIINYTHKNVQWHKYITTNKEQFAAEFLIKKIQEDKFASE